MCGKSSVSEWIGQIVHGGRWLGGVEINGDQDEENDQRAQVDEAVHRCMLWSSSLKKCRSVPNFLRLTPRRMSRRRFYSPNPAAQQLEKKLKTAAYGEKTELWKAAEEQIKSEVKEAGKMVLPSEVDGAVYHRVADFLDDKPLSNRVLETAKTVKAAEELATQGKTVAAAVQNSGGIGVDSFIGADAVGSITHPTATALENIGVFNTPEATLNTALGTAAGIVGTREAIDLVSHQATNLVKDVPVIGSIARTGEDILQFSLNPWTALATPFYAPLRIASAIYEGVTGKVDPIRDALPTPYEMRPTLGNAVERIADAFPILSPFESFMDLIGL